MSTGHSKKIVWVTVAKVYLYNSCMGLIFIKL